MKAIELRWATWRAVIAVRREKGLPSVLEHAEYLKRLLEQQGPDEATARLSLTGDVFLHSDTWARVQRRIPLPENCMPAATPGTSGSMGPPARGACDVGWNEPSAPARAMHRARGEPERGAHRLQDATRCRPIGRHHRIGWG
jgi:hypothetical protein